MEKRRNTIIIITSFIILIIAISILFIVNLLASNMKEDNNNTTTTKTSSTIDKTFRGYNTFELKDDDEIVLDTFKYYEFIFASNTSNDINNEYRGKVYNYTINIEDGELIFRESIENDSLNGYQETGMTYQFRTDNKITDFTISKSSEPNRYAIIVMDEKHNLYVYENDDKERSITKIISNIKKVKTISNIKRAGYYNYSNVPGLKNMEYDIIYEDTDNNIRYIKDKNKLFYEDAYYRYLGSGQSDEELFVLDNGLMRFGSKETALNDGNYNIYYRGTFYVYDEDNAREDIYIIGKDSYLYRINDFSSASLPLLNKVNIGKIKRIGTQVMRDENNFATSYQKVQVEFENGELFKIDDVLGFELLG